MKRYPHYMIDTARQLRRRTTAPEDTLWQRLRRHQLNGLKFKRQHRIGRYIVDFYCAELRLIIELEGRVHEIPDQKEYDNQRFEELKAIGYQVLKLKNEKVVEDIEGVLTTIAGFDKGPSPQ